VAGVGERHAAEDEKLLSASLLRQFAFPDLLTVVRISNTRSPAQETCVQGSGRVLNTSVQHQNLVRSLPPPDNDKSKLQHVDQLTCEQVGDNIVDGSEEPVGISSAG
jgi:hypothetical protein